MVINDEAHHIHDLSKNGEKDEVEWQKGLNAIAGKKGGRYFQIDFTATPYEQRGTGRNVRKAYFPHIVVDFDLVTAIREGLVKTLLIDRRQELTDLEHLTYLAERDDKGKPCALSDGQRLMLRAGLTKLKAWEKEFTGIDERKHPKMLVVCEDTRVSPLVEQFLMEEGLDKDEVLSIDSNKKGEVKEEEWKKIKARLFDIDRYDKPKVIISVLMLREGFDVNNICVIVPLRSIGSQILLEQTIGRGLRLMWREPEYQDMKRENRQLVLQRRNPENYIDMLSIIEHPAFLKFYEELFTAGAAGVEEGDTSSTSSVGDLIKVGLREGYEQYDFEWPVIVREAEEEQEEKEIDMNMLKPFSAYTLEKLRQFLATDGENFVAQELITKTSFGKYKVTADLFSATNYNGYLQKLLRVVTNRFERVAGHNKLPMLQVNDAQIVAAIDKYIRTQLFGQPFNPFNGNDWKILLANSSVVTKHIIEQITRAIHSLQESVKTTDAEVIQMKFSSVSELTMREQYALELTKTIYERQNYPTHGGGLEKAFMEFLDKDGEVERFLKINEHLHHFASICYIRTDGLLATYHPDFLAATAKKVYLIETKGRDKIDDRNVRQKQTAAALWIKKINELKPEMRMGREWEYVLIGEEQFYTLSHNGATLADICKQCKISLAIATGDCSES